jgi:hypothetical protein
MTANATTTASNFTGLYSGSGGTTVPTTPYGNANVVALLNVGSDGGNTVGNVIATGVVSAVGNITTNGYFIGNFQGNISGNLTVPGSNTQVLYNNSGNAGASAGFTFNSASNVATVAGNIVGGNITTAGNVTGNYILGNGSQLTGISAAVGGANSQVQFNDNGVINGTSGFTFNKTSNLVTIGANINAVGAVFTGNINTTDLFATANITGNALLVNGNALVANLVLYSNSRVFGDFTSNATSGARTVFQTTNATANSFSIISAIPGANNTANLGAATVMFSSANQANSSTFGLYTLGAESRLWSSNTGTGNVNDLTVTFGTAANLATTITPSGNISAVGNVSAANFVTSGLVSATGNVTGNYFIGNGSQLTGIATGTYGNANVATFLANFGSNSISTTGNITAGNVIAPDVYTSNITGAAGQNVTVTADGTGDIHLDADSIRVGDNNTAATIVTHGTGNLTLRTHEGDASQGNITIVNGANANIQLNPNGIGQVTTTVISASGNVTSGNVLTGGVVSAGGNITGSNLLTGGIVSAVGNITGANILTAGLISAGGNITGNFFLGNGSQLTGITTSAAGSNTQIQFNNAGAFAGSSLLTFDQATGNSTLNNVIIGSGTGTAAGGGLAQQINTTANNSGSLVTSTQFGNGQIVIGSGYFGNLALNNLNAQAAKGAKVVVWDSATVTDGGNAGIRYSALSAAAQLVVGNLNNNNTLFRSVAQVLSIGGGASANTLSQSTGQGLVGVAAAGGTLFVGQPNTTVALGNVTVGGGVGTLGQIIVYSGSTLGNAAGLTAQINSIGNTTTAMGVALQFVGTTTVSPTSLIGLYNPNNTTSFGVNNANIMRASPNYYFLKNDDAVAQNQLGSLRAYHEFQAAGTTSGTWNIDKTAGQVQAVSATGNITIGSYTNFVTTASNSVSALNQTDTVTLIIEQGATPYTVTMPTGNASIRYAANVSTVTATANTTTMVAITAYRTGANATGYLTTISPAFS